MFLKVFHKDKSILLAVLIHQAVAKMPTLFLLEYENLLPKNNDNAYGN